MLLLHLKIPLAFLFSLQMYLRELLLHNSQTRFQVSNRGLWTHLRRCPCRNPTVFSPWHLVCAITIQRYKCSLPRKLHCCCRKRTTCKRDMCTCIWETASSLTNHLFLASCALQRRWARLLKHSLRFVVLNPLQEICSAPSKTSHQIYICIQSYHKRH